MTDACPKCGHHFYRWLEIRQLCNVWRSLTNNISYNNGLLALVCFLKDLLAILYSCEMPGAGVEGLSFNIPFSGQKKESF